MNLLQIYLFYIFVLNCGSNCATINLDLDFECSVEDNNAKHNYRLFETRYRSSSVGTSLWTDGKVPYTIDTIYAPFQTKNMQKAMKLIEQSTCVRFVPRTNEQYYMRFTIECTHPVTCARACSSTIGRAPLDEQPNNVSLGYLSKCLNDGHENSIVHELMHTLGFYHEHQRPDRDRYITVNCTKIVGGCLGKHWKNFAVFSNTIHESIRHIPYDYSSLMHYAPTMGSDHGLYTVITPNKTAHKQAGSPIIGAYEHTPMSLSDIRRINILYGCSQINHVMVFPSEMYFTGYCDLLENLNMSIGFQRDSVMDYSGPKKFKAKHYDNDVKCENRNVRFSVNIGDETHNYVAASCFEGEILEMEIRHGNGRLLFEFQVKCTASVKDIELPGLNSCYGQSFCMLGKMDGTYRVKSKYLS